jgi:hypothetical protein
LPPAGATRRCWPWEPRSRRRALLEWQRLIRLINAKLDKQKTPRSALLVLRFFVLRLTVFAGAIYGSLKCFHGSVVALLCGLGLAVVAMAWEALRLLKD